MCGPLMTFSSCISDNTLLVLKNNSVDLSKLIIRTRKQGLYTGQKQDNRVNNDKSNTIR
jgi:hypothetical protein